MRCQPGKQKMVMFICLRPVLEPNKLFIEHKQRTGYLCVSWKTKSLSLFWLIFL